MSAVVLFLISKDISSAKLFKISEAVECIFSNETLWVVDRFFVDEFATVFIEVIGEVVVVIGKVDVVGVVNVDVVLVGKVDVVGVVNSRIVVVVFDVVVVELCSIGIIEVDTFVLNVVKNYFKLKKINSVIKFYGRPYF